MRKSKILIAISIIAVMLVPFSVFAATSNTPAAKSIRGFFGLDTSKMTDKQKADVKDYTQKMADLQKDFVNKMVENGALTKEQGESEIKKIEENLASGNTNGLFPYFGKGKGNRGGRGDFGFGKIDTSKLTDTQKADLNNTYKKMTDLQKNMTSKMVSNSLMTKEQGDTASKKVEEILKGFEENGSSKGFKMMMGAFGGFNCFGVKGVDTSKLTDQQKADLTDFSTKMAELQKELINKLVTYNIITRDQGDSAIQRMDNMKNFTQGKGSIKGMNKGRFGGKGRLDKGF
jgi:hypothetical protein